MAQKKIYLDYAATTPVAGQVLEAMLPFFSQKFGNASSVHGFGLETRAALDAARRALAGVLGAQPHEIVFTSGGTEANNLAIFGTARKLGQPGHLITSAVEHPSVLKACRTLEGQGWEVTYLDVDAAGRIDLAALKQALRRETALVSIMYANNETGTINPIPELAAIAAAAQVPFHTDAVQAFGALPLDLAELPGVTLMTVSGHKIYGPKGVAALFVRRGHRLQPQIVGGSQENKYRSGTENVPAIVGFARAAELVQQQRSVDVQHLQALSTFFIEALKKRIPDVVMNGHPEARVPHIVNFSFPGHENMALLMGLDLQGIAVSNGSACSSGSIEPSHVLKAMGLPRERQNSALRFSFGRQTTRAELEHTVEILAGLIASRSLR